MLALALGGCGQRRTDDQPVEVSVIGGPAALGDPNRGPLSPAGQMLLHATAQGLVRFDASGGIEPGLAERWIVIDDGKSVIFRLSEAEWPNGDAVTADDVVPVLRRVIARASRNSLAPYLTAIDEIVAMTPQVIEIRLSRPRPDILKLFAQPELAIPAPRGGGGTGPFRIERESRPGILLRPGIDPLRATDDEAVDPSPHDFVRLRGERAALAIARFAAKKLDLVSGGSIGDWPILKHAGIAPANIRVDAAAGLFGLAVANRDGFLADPINRGAVAMAIDRAALTRNITPNWRSAENVLPEQLDSAAPPAAPAWTAVAPDDRIATAQARVAHYQQSHPGPVTLRIAVPAAPGGTLIYAEIAAALRAVGLSPQRVDGDAPAELRLVDAVAPYDSARWYLRTACQPCGEEAATLIEAARDAPTLPERAMRLAEADAALAGDVAFIPIAQPLRWSLVAARLRAWTPNARAFHPLNHLRAAPR
ncbi:ABC transporter substrate-binding protein [Sphingomonas sp.]|uniref:ABC transporter substrate-binding protein n=1 Tax=Sphingomonas sp. TaxID=28214 RepID=UPI002B5547A0|nr:ABC transporter substrate-binding protein [Sphingomonas sp.]HWK34896.1 ABC transporter substrate-binding protein [Sphingomonas sp.]